MKYKYLIPSAAMLMLAVSLSQAALVGTAFTYQGRLAAGTNSATGLYDMSFAVFDALSGGSQFGGTIAVPAVPVTNGLFMISLDFGNIYDGNARWLSISVKTNGAGSYSVLTPRQPLSPTPYAIYASSAGVASLANTVAAGSIVAADLAPGAVTTTAIANGAVTTAKLAPDSVTHVELKSDVLSLPKVSAGLVTNDGQNIVISGTGGPIATNAFTGLGFQYYPPSGEGAILSSYENGFDGYGFLTFYTKNGPGNAPQKHMVIDTDGAVSVVGPDRVMVKPNGNVGIGTNNPQVTLDVYGTQNLSTHSDGIVNIGDSSAYHVSLDNNELHGRYGTNVSDLYINDFGGTVWMASGSLVAENGGVGIGSYWSPGDSALNVDGQVRINDFNIFLRGGTDPNHGLGYYGGTKTFAGLAPDGPVLFGFAGGALGTYQGVAAQQYALSWDSGQNVRVPGLLRSGSETGTSQPPSPAGMVVRRINSTSTASGQIIAATDTCTLQRDGTSGGIRLNYNASPGEITVAAMGINNAGGSVNFYTFIANPATAGSVQIYTDAQNVHHFECSFGFTYLSGHHVTRVTLSRYSGDYYWMGDLATTYNQ